MQLSAKKTIHNRCPDREPNCVVDLCICPDGVTKITVFGKRSDFSIFMVDWDEDTVKEYIEDVIRRTCND